MKIALEFNMIEKRWELVDNSLEGFRNILKVSENKEELLPLYRKYFGLWESLGSLFFSFHPNPHPQGLKRYLFI